MNDTIFALATAQGKAGIAVVRISGPQAVSAAQIFAGALPVPGRVVRRLTGPDGGVMDEAMVLTFAEGRSFTGEETVELHLHGSPAIVSVVLAALSSIPDLRQAEAGEFTRRALDNGCLDLAQVEGLADLIDAETEAQRKQALRVFSGDLGGMVEGWRAKLLHATALIEATIDFADEEVPVDVAPDVKKLLVEVRDEMTKEVKGSVAAERIRSGFEVAIVGAPNVGKSTLLNRLARRDAAITSEIAGTTRDVIEVQMDIAGFAVTLLDTAGLRTAEDTVESIGIERGRLRAEQADLRVYLLDGKAEIPKRQSCDDILVGAKADLQDDHSFSVSGITGQGVEDLVLRIGAALTSRSSSAGLAIRERHRVALMAGLAGLKAVLENIEDLDRQADRLAEDLRTAVRHVESLVGRVDVEDILGEIFSSFCIGK